MMNRRFSLLTLIVGSFALPSFGCVASSTFEQSQQKAYAQHQQDQRQILDLNIDIRRLKGRIEDLESSLKSEREQVTRIEQERKEVRDELLKLKIAQEQSARRPDRSTGERSASDLQDENGRLRDRLDEAKRRLKELSQQVQHLLEPS